MGRHHARVLSQRADIDLVAIADPRGAEALGGFVNESVRLVSDVHQAVRVGLDMAVVAVPSDQHAGVSCHLAQHGVATLIEKPLAPRSVDALEIVTAFDRSGALGAVGHIERYNPALRELKRRLDDGEIGEPIQMSTVRHGPRPARVRDVGVALDLATHDLDIGRWLLGCEYRTPAAVTLSISPGAPEDMIAVLDQMPSGVVLSHSVNWISTSKERRVSVLGTDGLLRADLLTSDLTREQHPTHNAEWDQLARLKGPSVGEVTSYAFPTPEPLAVEMDAFIAALRGDSADIVTLQDGLGAVSAAERSIAAATERSHSGHRDSVPYEVHATTATLTSRSEEQ